MSTRNREIRLAVVAMQALALFAVAMGQGLPGEYVITQKWRDLQGGYSALSNPAFLGEEDYTTLRGAFSSSSGKVGRLWEMGVTVPIGFYHSAGLTWIAEAGGNVQGGHFVNPNDPTSYRSSSGVQSNQSSFVTASYAINPWKTLTIGININGVYQTNFGDPETGVGADIGVSYRLLNHPILGYHLVGITYQNLIPPQASAHVEDERYAAQIRFTHRAELLERLIASTLQADITDFTARAENFVKGKEPETGWDFTWNLGVRLLRIIEVYGLAGVNSSDFEYWGVAGGMTLPIINNGRDASVLYQYRNDPHGSGFPSHSFYLRLEMGKHREEIKARRIYRTANFSPNKLYNKAMSLFLRGKYWDALFVFRTILVRHPDFFKNDWVQYYVGRCQEEMDMRSAAMASYEKAVVQYATSPVVHHANLGTMRVIYRNGDDGGVAEMFAKLNRDEVSDSLRHHARYIQGESFMRTGEYQKALQAFESIPMGHPEYMFAQHSVGVARIHELNLDAAVEAFTNSIEGDPQTPEEQEIANRSYLLVGFLFYERLSLNQAVAALRRVPETSYYYQDALLGLGWAAVKARQWGDCLEASLKLQSVSTRIPVRCEGLLLQAYALMMQKRHSEALAVLEAAQRETVDFEAPTDRELNERQNAADERRWEYDELAREVLEVSGQVGSSKQLANITDSLHRRQETLYDTLLAFQKYVDEHARSAFFARNMQTIRDDIDYAHAIVTKAVSGVAVREQAEKMYEEQKSLDEEIEMLQDQLEKDSGPAEGDSEEF